MNQLQLVSSPEFFNLPQKDRLLVLLDRYSDKENVRNELVSSCLKYRQSKDIALIVARSDSKIPLEEIVSIVRNQTVPDHELPEIHIVDFGRELEAGELLTLMSGTKASLSVGPVVALDSYDKFIDTFKEPPPESFDAYFYDIDGTGRKDISSLPGFLQQLATYPYPDSGTNKFVWIFYQLASLAKTAIEVGVFEGGTTVPFSLGLKKNNGCLYCVDQNLKRPRFHQRISEYSLSNLRLFEGSDLDFDIPELYGKCDFIFLDTSHLYEHTVQELFWYDRYLRDGGIMILHDIVNSTGVTLKNSREDYAYANFDELSQFVIGSKGTRPIWEQPTYKLAPIHLRGSVYLAMETFLQYRPTYRQQKILDSGGIGIIQKRATKG